VQKAFRYVKPFRRVNHECNRRTDGRTDALVLRHCVTGQFTADSVRQIGLAVAATVAVERAQLIAQLNMARHGHTRAPSMGIRDYIRYKNTLKLFIHLRSSSKKCNHSIRDVKSNRVAQKPNRNTKQNSVNASNIAHTRRKGQHARGANS